MSPPQGGKGGTHTSLTARGLGFSTPPGRLHQEAPGLGGNSCALSGAASLINGGMNQGLITGKAPWMEDLWESLRAFPMASHSWFLPARLYTWQGQQMGLRVSVLSHPVRTGLGGPGGPSQTPPPREPVFSQRSGLWVGSGEPQAAWSTPPDDLRSLGPPAPLPLSWLGHPALARIRLQTGERLSTRLVGAGRPRAAVSD